MENISSVNVSGNTVKKIRTILVVVLDSHQEFNQQFWRPNCNCKDESLLLNFKFPSHWLAKSSGCSWKDWSWYIYHEDSHCTSFLLQQLRLWQILPASEHVEQILQGLRKIYCANLMTVKSALPFSMHSRLQSFKPKPFAMGLSSTVTSLHLKVCHQNFTKVTHRLRSQQRN